MCRTAMNGTRERSHVGNGTLTMLPAHRPSGGVRSMRTPPLICPGDGSYPGAGGSGSGGGGRVRRASVGPSDVSDM